MIQVPAPSIDGSFFDVYHRAPGCDYNRIAGQAPLFVGHQTGSRISTSTNTAALEGGRMMAVNKGSSGTFGDVRTLSKAGRLKEALQILNQKGIQADSNSYACVLQECINMKKLAEGKQVHAYIIQSGFKPNVFLFNTLVNMYSKCGSVVDARQVFDKMPERNLFTWTIMIAGYAKHGQAMEAFKIYDLMQEEGVTPDKVTFICIVTACASLLALEKGKGVHADIIKAGIDSDVILETALVDMYAKCRSVQDACQVFGDMAKRNVVSWSAMIAGYAQNGYAREALQIYEQMIQEGVMPNKVTFICVVNACASLGALGKGKEVHGDISKAGIEPDIIMETALVDMYAKCGSVKKARHIFDNMAKRNVVSWSAMIAGYAQHGCGKEAFQLYEGMMQERVTPNKVTFICVVNACISLQALAKGKGVHADIIKAGLLPDMMLENSLIDMYAKCGSVEDARQVFDNMAQKDVVSWSTMVAGYAQHGLGKEAFEIFEQMRREGVTPNKVTFICIVNANAKLGALEKGKVVHADIIKAGIGPDIILETALVDMYAKCGSMKDAQKMFESMAQRNVFSWSVMITGYVQIGCAREVFQTHEQMVWEGVKPDKVTFVSLLHACAILGTLEKAKEVHADIMNSGIVPDIILETALVDMYAKCGSMIEARQVFDNMEKRDVVSWTAMVAGYAKHGCGREAFQMYEQMIQDGVVPNKVTLICILNACASVAALEIGKEIHADISKSGMMPDIILETALADMYAKCGSIVDARQVFDNMAQRNVVSWNAMIAGYAQHGCGREALQLFGKMQQEGFKPDGVTFISLLSACSHGGLVEDGRRYFESMNRDHGLTPTVEHFGCMVDLLGRGGRLDEAEDFISKMPIKADAGVWGALLSACRTHGDVKLAERVAECRLKCDPQHAAT